jgi:hypothetical protein
MSIKIKVTTVVESVGYCLANDAVAGSWCVLVRAQQAAGNRQGDPS